jgi:hypothetical protein
MNKFIISVMVFSLALLIMAWVVNREDTIRMEIAAQNGLVQCQQGNFVMWKKDCK